MKILLIGHSIIDRFEGTENDTPKPGGLFYSSLGVLSSIKSEDKVFLLTSWNDDSLQLFQKVYSQADLRYSNKIEKMPGVILKTLHEGEREEIYTNLSVQLSLDKTIDWNSFDGILINMITGFDLSLEQLKYIRQNYTGIIYIDIHTLARGVDQNMRREFRTIPNAKEWLSYVNVVQVNGSELKSVCEHDSEFASAREILSYGPKILIVTKGEHGSSLYLNENGNIQTIEIEAVKINSVNKVGCGDVFGAVFFYSYISTKYVFLSLNNANKAGAAAALMNNLTNYARLNFYDIQ